MNQKVFINWNDRLKNIDKLSHKDKVRFALFCANQVKLLLKDERSLDAIEVIQDWLDDKASDEDVKDVCAVVYASVYVAYAAVSLGVNSSSAFAASSSDSAFAAYAPAEREEVKKEQMKYLQELLQKNELE